MKYMGSKRRIAKHILPIMLKKAEEINITTWVEPFVGGANMIDKVPSDFKEVRKGEINTQLANGSKIGNINKIEKLFTL